MTAQPFTVEYHGQPLEFSPLYQSRQLVGYGYRHPHRPGFKCGWNWIDTESGTRHKLTFDAERRASIVGSLACPQKCGWHVVVENGVMRDV